MADLIVVFDACVLYPAPLRDFLMYMVINNVYSAKWTDAVDGRNSRRVDSE